MSQILLNIFFLTEHLSEKLLSERSWKDEKIDTCIEDKPETGNGTGGFAVAEIMKYGN